MRSPIVAALVLAIAAIVTAPDRTNASTPQRCLTPTLSAQTLNGLARGEALASHPLIGHVLFAAPRANPEECRAQDLLSLIRTSMVEKSVVLIGEVHDNPIHHRIRAALIRFAREAKPDGQTDDLERRGGAAIVFEHLRADQSPTIEKLRQTEMAIPSEAADAWLTALDWDKSGWPDKAMFKPLFEEVISGRHPVYAGEPARGVVRDISRQGFAAVATDEIKRLGLDTPLPEPQQNALLDDLEASHCGLMPRTAFGKMAEAQRYRDAHLASVVEQAAQKHGAAILLAGNGHVRRDRGVPHYLHRNGVAIALIEVEDGKASAGDYLERGPDGKPVYDAILFTARADRKDPCVEMREMMQKRK